MAKGFCMMIHDLCPKYNANEIACCDDCDLLDHVLFEDKDGEQDG